MTATLLMQAVRAITARHPGAWDIVWCGDNNYSARLGHCVAYYVIIDGQIAGDVWYE